MSILLVPLVSGIMCFKPAESMQKMILLMVTKILMMAFQGSKTKYFKYKLISTKIASIAFSKLPM